MPRLLQLVDAIAAGVAALDAPVVPLREVVPLAQAPKGRPRPEAAPSLPTARAAEALDNVRVDVGEMDALVEGLTEVSVRLTAMRAPIDELRHARTLAAQLARSDRDAERDAQSTRRLALELQTLLGTVERALGDGLLQTGRELGDVGEQAHRLRLMPVSAMFATLERAARDVGHAQHKDVAFATSGGDQRVDANVLAPLREALLHVVRNAVAHGLESADERRAAGKPPIGQVRLEVERRQNRIAFSCRDDGRGIDVAAVRRSALARGIVGEAEAAAMAPAELVRLVLHAGVTTAPELTEIAGRGVGLDVVRAAAVQLKGDVTIDTKPGRGTTIEVCVPISLSSLPALVVEAGGVRVALPLDAVQEALRVTAADIAGAPTHDSLVVQGRPLPFVRLAALVPGAALATAAAACPAVVVRGGDARAAFASIGCSARPSSSCGRCRAWPVPARSWPAPRSTPTAIRSSCSTRRPSSRPRTPAAVAPSPRRLRSRARRCSSSTTR